MRLSFEKILVMTHDETGWKRLQLKHYILHVRRGRSRLPATSIRRAPLSRLIPLSSVVTTVQQPAGAPVVQPAVTGMVRIRSRSGGGVSIALEVILTLKRRLLTGVRVKSITLLDRFVAHAVLLEHHLGGDWGWDPGTTTIIISTMSVIWLLRTVGWDNSRNRRGMTAPHGWNRRWSPERTPRRAETQHRWRTRSRRWTRSSYETWPAS